MPHHLGRHLLLDLHDCARDLLGDVAAIETHMVRAAQAAGATIINTTFHHFAPAGVSGVVVIQESHLSIHTWPEYGFAAVDIFTCGETVDPRRASTYLKRALKARKGQTREHPRGEIPAIKPSPKKTAPPAPAPQRNLWFTERRENLALSLRHAGLIFETQSPVQKIQIFETYGYGRMLVLDGQVMCTEGDECVYHEMITHVPAFAHGNPQSVIVIGGGDGGAVRELLKHRNIKQITLVEIDAEVITSAQKYLPTMASNLTDKRVSIHIADGTEFLAASNSFYDLILIDVPGEVNTAKGLLTTDFYETVSHHLTPRGIVVAQGTPPSLSNSNFRKILHLQQRVFGQINTFPYSAFIPTYTMGMIFFALATKTARDPGSSFDYAAAKQFSAAHALKYYTPKIHAACFALPPLIQTHLQ